MVPVVVDGGDIVFLVPVVVVVRADAADGNANNARVSTAVIMGVCVFMSVLLSKGHAKPVIGQPYEVVGLCCTGAW